MPTPAYRFEHFVELTEDTAIRVDGYVYAPYREETGEFWDGWRVGPTYTLVGCGHEMPHLPKPMALDMAADELGAAGDGAERRKNAERILDDLALEDVTEQHQERVLDHCA